MANKIRREVRTVDLDKGHMDLSKEWLNEEVISLAQAKQLIAAFKAAGLKNEEDCLIFNGSNYTQFRKIGQQRNYQIMMTKKLAKEWDKWDNKFPKKEVA